MKRYIIALLCGLISISSIAAPARKKGKTTPKKRVVERLEKGSFYQIAAGGGVSSLQYDLQGGSTHLYPSLNLQFGYTYYFNKYAGITTGLQYDTYTTRAVMNSPLEWNDLYDYMYDRYNHYTEFNNWQERQTIHSLEIPLGLALKFKQKKAGVYVNLGAKLGIAVDQHYKNTRGTVTHYAYYPYWNVTMRDLPGRYETEDYSGTTQSLDNLHRFNGIGYAEIGTLIELNPHTDLTIGAYANIYINNACKFTAEQRQDLGFATRINNYGSFMNPYNGLIGTTQAGSVVRPWSAGLKIGISITPQRTDKEKERKAKQLYRQYRKYLPECPSDTIHDTVFIYTNDSTMLTRHSTDTIHVHDTVLVPCMECALRMMKHTAEDDSHKKQKNKSHDPETPKQENAPQAKEYSTLTKQQSIRMDSMLQGAVIWFHFDEYVPILQPEYILDSIAHMLLKNPQLKVHVNGHACSIGSDSYNQRLALKRAQAVAGQLTQKGVKAEQLIVESFGAKEPFRYQGKHQLSTDRRVEIIPELYGKDIKLKEMQTEGVSKLYTKFVGEEKIEEGMRLSKLARKWYNHSEYWVYIYEANADVISNPNDLPVGITIMIPDLKASFADDSESEMLRRARNLEPIYKTSN